MTKLSDDIVYGRQALSNGEPWIVPESLSALKTVIQPQWTVFEWGSGGSTVFWAKNCQLVISIEHNLDWIRRTMENLYRLQAPRHRVQLQYWPGEAGSFRKYSEAIMPYREFDLVYIDGEASSRGWCLNHAITRVKVGGYLLLDNSDWLKRDLGDDWEREDYVAKDLKWVGQPGTFNWWTSLLHKVK